LVVCLYLLLLLFKKKAFSALHPFCWVF